MRTTFDNKCLASWAVFKRFGESDHKDRYGVLCEFVKATIYKHSLREFTIAVLTEHVNSDYSFNLKPAVIAFAIQRLQIKNDSYGKYTCVPDDFLEQKAILDAIDNEKRESDNVIIQLFKYIESKHQEALIESEKEQIVQSFINYILDNSYSDKYASEISSFVIAYKKGNTISVPLETILEGVVSYAGITFDTPASASSRFPIIPIREA